MPDVDQEIDTGFNHLWKKNERIKDREISASK